MSGVTGTALDSSSRVTERREMKITKKENSSILPSLKVLSKQNLSENPQL